MRSTGSPDPTASYSSSTPFTFAISTVSSSGLPVGSGRRLPADPVPQAGLGPAARDRAPRPHRVDVRSRGGRCDQPARPVRARDRNPAPLGGRRRLPALVAPARRGLHDRWRRSSAAHPAPRARRTSDGGVPCAQLDDRSRGLAAPGSPSEINRTTDNNRRNHAPRAAVDRPAEPVGRLDVTPEHGLGLDSQRAQHLPPRPERRCTSASPLRPHATTVPPARAIPASSWASLVLPMPGSPAQRTRRPVRGGHGRATPATTRARAVVRRCRRRSRARDCPSSVLHAPQACPAAPDCGSDAALGQTDSNFAIVTGEARPAFPRRL